MNVSPITVGKSNAMWQLPAQHGCFHPHGKKHVGKSVKGAVKMLKRPRGWKHKTPDVTVCRVRSFTTLQGVTSNSLWLIILTQGPCTRVSPR